MKAPILLFFLYTVTLVSCNIEKKKSGDILNKTERTVRVAVLQSDGNYFEKHLSIKGSQQDMVKKIVETMPNEAVVLEPDTILWTAQWEAKDLSYNVKLRLKKLGKKTYIYGTPIEVYSGKMLHLKLSAGSKKTLEETKEGMISFMTGNSYFEF